MTSNLSYNYIQVYTDSYSDLGQYTLKLYSYTFNLDFTIILLISLNTAPIFTSDLVASISIEVGQTNTYLLPSMKDNDGDSITV